MAEQYLTEEQVRETLNFAEQLYIGEKMGWYNPFLSNTLLQRLNNNPLIPNTEKIEKSLANYMNSAEQIQSYVEFMSHWDMIFERTLYSYVNALAFDLIPVCTNMPQGVSKDSDEYKAYLKDKQRVKDFLTKFDYKDNFRKVVMQLLKKEVYYVWFRKTKWDNQGMKYALQTLPQDRCMLTGYWEKGMIFDVDMSYFLQAGVDINGYDPAFKKYYKKVFGESKGIENYYPTNQFGKRDGIYAMWTQTSPTDGAWVFKFNSSDFNTTPFIAPFLRDAIRDSEIAQLQYNKDMASAYAILVGELRLFNDAKTGTQANQFAIDPKQVGAFMSKARAGLDSAIKLAALPTENTKWYQFEDKNKEMYSNQLSATAGVGSGLSRVIYSSDRQSNAEIEAGMTEMYSTMKQIYPQFQNFLEFFVNQQTKKYHWRFIFEGSNYKFEREARFDKLIKLADRGMVMPPSVWGATVGYNPFDFEDLLLETKESDWIDKITRLLPNTNTTSQKSEGGRPRSDSSELTESGEASRDSLEVEGD